MFINMTTSKCEITYVAHILFLLDSAALDQKGRSLFFINAFQSIIHFFSGLPFTHSPLQQNLVFSTLGFSWIPWHEWFIIHLFPTQACFSFLGSVISIYFSYSKSPFLTHCVSFFILFALLGLFLFKIPYGFFRWYLGRSKDKHACSCLAN